MRKRFNKLTKIFTSILLLSSTMLSTVQIKANVIKLEDTGYWHSGQSRNPSNPAQTAWYDHQKIEKIHVEQGIGVCSEPWEVIGGWTGYDTSMVQDNQISYIWYYAYVNTDQSNWNYAVGQLMVWEYLGYKPNSHNVSGYDARKAEVNAAINKMKIMPSFSGENIILNVGESITLNDTNGVLSDFKGKETIPTGLTIKRNGDKLTITATAAAADNSTYSLNKIKPDMVGQSIVHRKPGGQDIIKPMIPDPARFRLNIRVNKHGSLKLLKMDEDGTPVPNTSFKVSANQDMSSPIGTFTTDADGLVTVTQLLPNTYFIQEVAVPSYLVLDSTVHSVTVQANQTATFNARNNWVKGKIQLRKTDAESGKQVANATYGIFDVQNRELERLVTTATGVVESGYLRFGSYTVKEIIAPDGYVLNTTVYPVTISSNEEKIEVTGTDKRVKGTIELSKEDSETGKQPQGDATLTGAVYELKARNNILDPADGSIKYVKDSVVATLTTDVDANVTISGLYLGDYYVVEKIPSNGYTLDLTQYDISLTYENQNVEVVTKKQTVKERVAAQAFSIIKISDNDNGETDILKGVEFTVKAQKDIVKAGSWEKAPIAKNAKGEISKILVTDEKGYAVSDELPFGTYVVRETKVPADHYKVDDFTVVINKDSRDPQPWRIFNDKKFKAVISIIKKDTETGKTIALPGAEFKIRNTETKEYVGFWKWNPFPHYVDSWTTDETGSVFTDDVLTYGNYEIVETKAPHGYTLDSTPIPFRIAMNGAYETLPDGTTPVITVIKNNSSVKGRITVSKEGEVLTSTSKDDEGNTQFHYTKQKLANAVFEVYANENIKTADNQGDILYKKGELVETLMTKANGTDTTKLLPLGKYQIREKTAPNGFIHNAEVKNIELTYKDEDTAVVFHTSSYLNDRQKVNMKIVKRDTDSQTPLQGAIFGLSADANIYAPDHTLLVKKGELIETSVTDENGNIQFKADLPLSNYTVKEITPPVGYASSDEIISIDASYKGQYVKVITYEKEFFNKITNIEISKKDITNKEEIAGAHLRVYPKDEPGAVFDSWISGQDGRDEKGNILPHQIKGLEYDRTYILHEVSSPYGYAITQDIEFIVKNTGDVQKVEMMDEPVFGQLKWNKTAEIFNQVVTGQTEFGKSLSPIWNSSNIPGAEITIYAAQDIVIGNHTYYRANEKVETLESKYESVMSKKLPVGKYFYKETKTPHGYLTDTNKHFFEIKDNQISDLQVITSTLTNKRPIVDIDMIKILEKQDIYKNDDAYKNVIFGIYAREDIFDYKGNVALPYDTMITTSGIDKDGHLKNVPDLPNGLYYIRELQTDPQYVLDINEYDFEIAYHGADVASYVVQIGIDGKINNALARGSVHVRKLDTLDAAKKLKGIEFEITADADMKHIIATEKTDVDGIATFKNLELGVYYIREAKQVDGYVLNNHIYKVEVTADGDILQIDVENKPVEMEFSKIGETGTTELSGATMQVIDKQSGKIIEAWISGKKSYKLKYLIEGKKYILQEVKAPSGYEVAAPIEFIAGDGKKITMQDKKIRSYIKVNKVDYYDRKDILKVAEFTLYEDETCTKPIRSAKTDTNNGIAIFDNLTYGTFFIKETKAPAGYQLSKEIVKVTINDDWINGNDKMRTIIFPDRPLPTLGGPGTGDTTNVGIWYILAGISVICILIIRRKKHAM